MPERNMCAHTVVVETWYWLDLRSVHIAATELNSTASSHVWTCSQLLQFSWVAAMWTRL